MDKDVFKSKVFPLKDKLFRMARYMLSSNAEAEDMVQEVFIKLWDKKDHLDSLNNIEAYAMRATKNMCLNYLTKKRINASEDIYQQKLIISKTLDPNRFLENTEMHHELHELINFLPGKQKLVMQLRGIEGYTIDEIATITEDTTNNVKVALCRARAALKKAFKESKTGNFSFVN